MARRVEVIGESKTGRNERFRLVGGRGMSRTEFVRRIERGEFPDYHVRRLNGVKTPASNPNQSERDNLG